MSQSEHSRHIFKIQLENTKIVYKQTIIMSIEIGTCMKEDMDAARSSRLTIDKGKESVGLHKLRNIESSEEGSSHK